MSSFADFNMSHCVRKLCRDYHVRPRRPRRLYEQDLERWNATGERVVIDGPCMSACTLYLGAKNVCVTPRAEFWFHAGWRAGANPDNPDSVSQLYDSPTYRRYLPPRVWRVASSAGWLRRPGYNWSADLSAAQVVALGVKAC